MWTRAATERYPKLAKTLGRKLPWPIRESATIQITIGPSTVPTYMPLATRLLSIYPFNQEIALLYRNPHESKGVNVSSHLPRHPSKDARTD